MVKATLRLFQEALDALCPLGVQVLVRDGSWAQAQGMEAFLAVARGSAEPPLLLECHYRGAGDDLPVLLAAPALTFDRCLSLYSYLFLIHKQ